MREQAGVVLVWLLGGLPGFQHRLLFEMADLAPVAALISSGTPILNAAGLLLEVCSEAEIDSVQRLSFEQKNALKMVVRTRTQSPGMIDELYVNRSLSITSLNFAAVASTCSGVLLQL